MRKNITTTIIIIIAVLLSAIFSTNVVEAANYSNIDEVVDAYFKPEIFTYKHKDKLTAAVDVPAININNGTYYGVVRAGTSCELDTVRVTNDTCEYIFEVEDNITLGINSRYFVNTTYYNKVKENAEIVYNLINENESGKITYTESVFEGKISREFGEFVKYFNIVYCNATERSLFFDYPGIVYTNTGDNTYSIDIAATKKNINAIPNILKSLNLDGKSDLEKVYAIEKYISKMVDYDYSLTSHGNIKCLNDGKGICIDYASTFYTLATAAGIKTDIIIGYASNDGHAWNCVYIDGKWYYLDITFYDYNYNSKYLLSEKPFSGHIIGGFVY